MGGPPPRLAHISHGRRLPTWSGNSSQVFAGFIHPICHNKRRIEARSQAEPEEPRQTHKSEGMGYFGLNWVWRGNIIVFSPRNSHPSLLVSVACIHHQCRAGYSPPMQGKNGCITMNANDFWNQ